MLGYLLKCFKQWEVLLKALKRMIAAIDMLMTLIRISARF